MLIHLLRMLAPTLLFGPDDGTTGGTGTDTGTDGATSTDTGTDGATSTDTGTDGVPAGRTFTQAELDDIVNKRLARDRAKVAADLATLKERGDLDEVARLKLEIADKDTAISAAAASVLVGKVETRAERAAIAAGVKPDRLDRFLRLVDLSDIDALTADGKPDATAIEALIAATLTDVPEFKGAAGAPAGATGADFSGADGKPTTWTREAIGKLSTDEFAKHEAEITAQMKAGKIK